METALSIVPDLSYQSEFSLAHDDKEILINGAKIIFDKKAPLTAVTLEPAVKNKKYEPA